MDSKEVIFVDTESLWLYNNIGKLIVVVTLVEGEHCRIWDLTKPEIRSRLREYLNNQTIVTWNGKLDVVRLQNELGITINHIDLKEICIENKICNQVNTIKDILYTLGISHKFNITKWQTNRIYENIRKRGLEITEGEFDIISQKCVEDTKALYKIYQTLRNIRIEIHLTTQLERKDMRLLKGKLNII